MKLLYALMLACFSSAFGQQQGSSPASALPCPLREFKAASFNMINYELSYCYHATLHGLAYYVNNANDGAQLFDFNTGTVYVQPADGGDCYRHQDDDAQVNKDPLALVAKSRRVFTSTGPDLVTRTGVEVQNGRVTLRNVYADVPSCDIVFFSLTLGGEMLIARGFQNHEALPDDDLAVVQDALSAFKAADCELRDF